jgi:DNA processing protein
MERDELAAWLRLALTPGVGNLGARRLLAAFGLPHAVFAQDTVALQQVVGEREAKALQQPPDGFDIQLERTLEWLNAADAPAPRWIVTLADAEYPQGLLRTEDPPVLLYVTGQRQPTPDRAIAVVGSRNPTPQGSANARAFSRAFAEAGLTVVSGLALGIDGAAHEGALEGAAADQLATIAVVGTGLDRVYPKQHLALARRIVQRGLIVSEYPLGTPPLAENFPRRNRIISALSEGTLVVEAALQSGSLITARMASEQGKDVFAVPGSIHAPQSRGCHALIKQGAKLVETAQDVLEELRLVPSGEQPAAAAAEPAPPYKDVLAALGFDPVGLDALIARTGIAAPQLQAQLLELELAGHVARLPGGLFQRVGAA